jgi:ferredoxin
MTRAQTPRHVPRHEHAHAPTTEPHATANPVRVVVDLNRCQAYAQCCFLAPSVFMLHGEEALWYDPAPAAALQEQVRQAAAACPVQAITVEWPAGPGRQHRKHAEHREQREAPHAAQRS